MSSQFFPERITVRPRYQHFPMDLLAVPPPAYIALHRSSPVSVVAGVSQWPRVPLACISGISGVPLAFEIFFLF